MPLPANELPKLTPMQTSANPTFPNGSVNAGKLTLVFRVRSKADQKMLIEHKLVLMPTTFTQETEARTSLYYTKGGIVADTPSETGIGMTVFTIAGHTGFRGITAKDLTPNAGTLGGFLSTVGGTVERVVTGIGPPPTGSLIDGAAAIKDLQDTIEAYFFPQGHSPQTADYLTTQELQLEFLNLAAPASATDPGKVGWLVHPHRNLVSIRQDASKPFLYQYQFSFAGIGRLDEPRVDPFVTDFTDPRTTFRRTMDRLNGIVRDVTNGVNTITDAFNQMVIQNVTGPISTFLEGCTSLSGAVANFVGGLTSKIQFPLYAQRTLEHILDAPSHSVTTLAMAARDLATLLHGAAEPRSISRTPAGETLTGGINDVLALRLNNEAPVTLSLGTQSSGPTIAARIQEQIRAQSPQVDANVSAYRDFTCTFAMGQYQLLSGTKMSDAGSVQVVTSGDPELTPTDASSVLGLGVANGGQEHLGSAYPLPAIALLRGVEEACKHLQAFPDFFADQLEAQDAALAAMLPVGVHRPQIRGDQRLQQTRITPGDSLQSIGARVGVPPEVLALVNRLTYPYILELPGTLLQGRVSSADLWSITDVLAHWPVDRYQGQRLDLVSGPGAGQSRRILRNTPTQLVLEHAWDTVPNDITNYAIRAAENPIVQTGTVTASTARTVTDGLLALVPDSQRGLTLMLTSGPTAGEQRRVVANDQTTFALDHPWDVVPTAGSLYLLLGPQPATRRQLLVGDLLSVPRPSAQALTPIRSRLQDVSAITGRHGTVEEKLLGIDLLLDTLSQSLVYDAAVGDARLLHGLPNLRQAVVNLVNLPIGELEYQPSLGSYVQEEIGLQASLPLQNQLLASVVRTVKQDKRIAKVGPASVVTQGGFSTITFTAVAVNGSTLDRVTVR